MVPLFCLAHPLAPPAAAASAVARWSLRHSEGVKAGVPVGFGKVWEDDGVIHLKDRVVIVWRNLGGFLGVSSEILGDSSRNKD